MWVPVPDGGSNLLICAIISRVSILKRFEWDGTARELFSPWTLVKDDHTARCRVVTHPIGWELRLEIDGEVIRSNAHRDDEPMILDIPHWCQDMLDEGGTRYLASGRRNLTNCERSWR